MEMLRCPVCEGEVTWQDTYDCEFYHDIYVERCTGTCDECGEEVDYDIIYPLGKPNFEIISHYTPKKQ